MATYKTDAAVRALAHAREFQEVAAVVTAQAIAVLAGDGASERELAAHLGVSRSAVRGLARPARSDNEDARLRVDARALEIWSSSAAKPGGWRIAADSGSLSCDLMRRHGLPPLSDGRFADTTAREYENTDNGERLLLYTTTRWDGVQNRDAAQPDHRGRYVIELCPGPVTGDCAASHQAFALGLVNLAAGDELFGRGWTPTTPTDGQVFERLSTAIESSYGVFDPWHAFVTRYREG